MAPLFFNYLNLGLYKLNLKFNLKYRHRISLNLPGPHVTGNPLQPISIHDKIESSTGIWEKGKV